ncbi:MAG: flagellin [Paracoccaceae bacterium]
MSSILTNNGAMVALQTMKSINKNMGQVQAEISTGKAVGSARDNAAVWAISKTMESDVSGFKAISDSLALGSSTINVARKAAEDITDLLKEMKLKVVGSQEANVDRSKIQADVAALRDQIGSIVGAAQFNGLNLLSNRQGGTTVTNIVDNLGAGVGILGSSKVAVLSSLDRSATGVSSSSIQVGKQDLGTQARIAGTGTDIAAGAFTGPTAVAAGATSTAFTVVGDTATAARRGNQVIAGDTYGLTGLTGITAAVNYVARDGDSLTDIAKGLTDRINFEAKKMNLNYTATQSGATFTINNGTNAALTTGVTVFTGGTAGGGLEMLREVDVTTTDGAKAALSAIEGLTQKAIGSAATFGTAQKRIDVQQSFVSNLMDSLKSGIGSMVDANMEETSARLQALQVQQQLATQSLSIANQAPQSILALFR